MTTRHPTIVITRRLAPGIVEGLAESCQVRQHDSDVPMSRAALLDSAAGSGALLSTLADVVDSELLDAAGPGLRIVATHAVGFHNIDIPACTARGVIVTNTPDVLTDATADLAWALLLAAARRVGEGERWIRAGKPWQWAPTFLLGRELRGATLGIIGLGRIGRAVARRGVGFGMTITYHNRQPVPPHLLGGLPARYSDLPALLADSDVICLCCPLTEQTRHLLDATALKQMRASAILVNIAAGGIVDENALADALDASEIFAAALDGYEHEPEVHPRLITHERVVLAPHLGSATEQTRHAMGLLAARNILAVLTGHPPLTPVPARTVEA